MSYTKYEHEITTIVCLFTSNNMSEAICILFSFHKSNQILDILKKTITFALQI